MDSVVERVLAMQSEKRRLLRLKRRSRGPYRKIRFTRDELIDYLVDNSISSVRQLARLRKADDPKRYDYDIEFGKWSEAQKAAFGPPSILEDKTPSSAEYLVKLLVQYDVWTVNKYLEWCRKRPDVFPSFYYVKKHWGRFSNLTYIARRFSYKQRLESYLCIKRRLGHWPTVVECLAEGLDVSAVIKELFGSRKEMIILFEKYGKA